MTSDEARDRVGRIRGHLDDAMRALCVPGPDWHEAMRSLRRAMILCGALSHDCLYESFRRIEHGDR